MKIIGYAVIGPGEGDKYLKRVLDRNLSLVDKMVVLGLGTDRHTEEILLSYPNLEFRRYPENVWGEKQNLVKEALLNKYVAPYNPDWCLAFDADEEFDKRLTREKLEELAQNGLAWNFRFIQFWNDELHYRNDGGWGGFWNCRFFKFKHGAQDFLKRALHCGLCPQYAYANSANAYYIVKHFGYMNPEDRKKKIERYKTFDPKRIYNSKDWYASMEWADDDKRVDIREFKEDEFLNKMPQVLRQDQKDRKVFEPASMKEEFLLVRRPDQRVIEVRKSVWEDRQKQWTKQGYAVLQPYYVPTGGIEAPVVEAMVEETTRIAGMDIDQLVNKCSVCGRISPNAFGLRVHQNACLKKQEKLRISETLKNPGTPSPTSPTPSNP